MTALEEKPVFERPSLLASMLSPMGILELAVLAKRRNELRGLPKGEGTVLIIPGFLANDATTLPLRKFLTKQGYTTYGWDMGLNIAQIEVTLPVLRARIKELVAEANGPITIIGWSLGGVMARELARELPKQIKHVITLGAPLDGGPGDTGAAYMLEHIGFHIADVEAAMIAHGKTPLEMPLTVIHSKMDGMIAWEASIDHYHKHAEHFEVSSTHIGLGLDIDVFKIIAKQLAKYL